MTIDELRTYAEWVLRAIRSPQLHDLMHEAANKLEELEAQCDQLKQMIDSLNKRLDELDGDEDDKS